MLSCRQPFFDLLIIASRKVHCSRDVLQRLLQVFESYDRQSKFFYFDSALRTENDDFLSLMFSGLSMVRSSTLKARFVR